MIATKFDHIEHVGDSFYMFWFKPEERPSYVAGQFTEIRLPHDSVDDRGDKRWFTLSSSPTEPLLAITTRRSETLSSFKQQLFSLKPGTPVNLAEPMGDFVLPKQTDTPLVFITTGIGITPSRSMIRWLLDKNQTRRIQLIHKPRQGEKLPYSDLFESYGASISLVDHDLTAATVRHIIGNHSGKLLYLSGPEPMVEKMFDELQLLGVAGNQLVTDYFHGYPED